MKCSKCGEEVNADQGFCLKCGNPIQADPDFNTIEAELASSVSEFLQEDTKEGTVEDTLPNISDEEPMVTVDVPYDEINMQLKMVDISREQEKLRNSREKVTNKNVEKTVEKIDATSKKDGKDNKNASKKSKKKLIITLSIIGAIALVAIIVGIVIFITDYNSKRTYEGNYENAQEASDDKEYDEAIKYALKAVELSTSDREEISARMLLDEIYKLSNKLEDDYADNLKELIGLGETSSQNYETLVKYYFDKAQYENINDLVVVIKDDSVYTVISDYIPAAPVADKETGNYAGYVVVKLTADTGCKIYYTLNSQDNLNGGVEYRDGVKILGEGTTKLTCYSVDANGVESQRVSFEYVIKEGELEGPKVTPSSGSYSEYMTITVEVPEGGKAYYTLDGTDPNTESKEYTEPIDMPRGTSRFKVIVYDKFDLPSAITSESYNLSIPRGITVNDSVSLVKDKLVEEDIMSADGKTTYGTMTVNYDSIAIIGKEEYYIIVATEKNTEGTVLSATIYGVNTYDSTLNTEIIDANGVYTLPDLAQEEETTTQAN